MSSFEFHVGSTFASCQYHADEFFIVLDDVLGDFPLMNRARVSFEGLNDDVFTFSDGEANNLHSEIKKISATLKLEQSNGPKKHLIFFHIADELEGVFRESERIGCDIQFRWG